MFRRAQENKEVFKMMVREAKKWANEEWTTSIIENVLKNKYKFWKKVNEIREGEGQREFDSDPCERRGIDLGGRALSQIEYTGQLMN